MSSRQAGAISSLKLMPLWLIRLPVAEAQLDTCPAEPVIAKIPLIMVSVSTWIQLLPSVPLSHALTFCFKLCSPLYNFLLSPAHVLSPDGPL